MAVGLGHELDDEVWRQAGEVAGDHRERDVVGDRQMMDEGESQHDVAFGLETGSIGEAGALVIAPADSRAGVGQIDEDREKLRLVVAADMAVIVIDRRGINVSADDQLDTRLLGCHPAVVTIVGAEIEDLSRFQARAVFGHQLSFGGARSIVIVGLVVVISPGGVLARRGEFANRTLQAGDQSGHRVSRDIDLASRFALAAGGGAIVLVASLQASMSDQVGDQAELEAATAWQQVSRQRQRHAIDVDATELQQIDIAVAGQRQRCQEVLTKLLISDPRLLRLDLLEGQCVDEDRPSLLSS